MATGTRTLDDPIDAQVDALRSLALLPSGDDAVAQWEQWATDALAHLPTSLSPRLRAIASSAVPDPYTQATTLLHDSDSAEPAEGRYLLPLLAATQLFYDPTAFLAPDGPQPPASVPILLSPRTPLLPCPASDSGPQGMDNRVRAAAAAVVLVKATDAVSAKPALSAALLGPRIAHSHAQFEVGNVKGSFEADVYAVVGTNSRTSIGPDLSFPRAGQLPGSGLDALFDPGPAPEPWQTVFPLAHLTQIYLLFLAVNGAQDGSYDEGEKIVGKAEAWFKRLLTAQSAAHDLVYGMENALAESGHADAEDRLRIQVLNTDIEVRGAAAVQEVQSILYILNGRTLDAAQALVQLTKGTRVDKVRTPYLLHLASVAILLAPASAARDRVLEALVSDDRLGGVLEPLVRKAQANRSLDTLDADTLRSQAGFAGQRPAPLSANDKALFAASEQGERPHAVSTALEYALATHNIRSAGEVYSRVSLDRLGELVGLSTVGTEALVRTLIRENRLSASIDQKAGTIVFAPPGLSLDTTQSQDQGLTTDENAGGKGTVAVESSAERTTALVEPLNLRKVVEEHTAAHTGGQSFVPQSQSAAQGATAAIAVWDARVAAVASAVEKIHFALSVRGDVPAL